MSFLFRPISRLFRVGKSRHLAGTDLEGNRYYEYPSLHGSDDPRHTRRLIEYRVKKDHYSEYDTKNVAVQWKMWLRHTRMDPPPLDELEADKQRMLRLQENVRLIAVRDEESRRAAEVKRLEEYGQAVSSFQEQKQQQQQHPSGPRSEQASPPVLGETPDQGQAQTEASDRAASSAQQTLRDLNSSPSSSTPANTAAAAPDAPRPRPRTRTSAVPTSQVQDEGIPQQQRARRVPISVTRPRDANSDEAQGGSHLAGQISEVREADNDVWQASRDRIRRQDNAGEVDSSGGRRSYSTVAIGSGRSRQRGTRNVLASMRPGLGVSLPLSTAKTRPFSTGPIRPPSHSSRPTPSPRPVPPTPQPLPPRSKPQAAAASAPSRPDVPKFVYIVGGGVIVFGLAVIWILPGEFTTLTKEKLNHSRLSGSSASSIKADSWSTLPILRSIYAVSPSNLEDIGDGQHRLISIGLGPSAPKEEGATHVGRRPLSISSISIAQPHIQIERSYTPLQSPLQADAEGKLDLLVKRYADGEMGRYLHGLSVGEGVEVRGWIKSWDESWMKSLADAKSGLGEIVLIVGGTGIAPAYQLISSICRPPSPVGSGVTADTEPASSPSIKLLYASARPSSFLLLPELKALEQSNSDRLQVTLFSEEGLGESNVWSSIKGRLGVRTSGHVGGLPTLQGRIQLADLQKGLSSSSSSTEQDSRADKGRAILVIGTEGMVESMAGRRGMTREGRVTQGRLGGLLREVHGVQEEEVWKL